MKILKTIPLLLLLLVSEIYGQELYLLSTSIGQGEVLTCFVYPAEDIKSAEFVLEDSAGNVIDTNPGFLYSPDGKQQVMAALFGIPSTAKEGVGNLSVTFKSKEGRQERSALVSIAYRDFMVEIINLSESAGDILTTPDPRKKEQAQKLWSVLLSWNPGHVFSDAIFNLPVSNFEETAWYGDRRTFKYPGGGSASTTHGGLDLAADTGEPVKAPADGLVVLAEERIISGWTVVLEHLPGVYSMYYHLSRMDTAEGQNVRSGHQLGLVGATGLVTGPHLHWEIKIHGISVDPKWFLTHPLIDKEAILDSIESTVQKRR